MEETGFSQENQNLEGRSQVDWSVRRGDPLATLSSQI